jgi:acyl carrier protein
MNLDEQEILNSLSEIFNDIFFMDETVLEVTLSQKDITGWDSFNHINLVMAVEEKFRIKINIQKMQELKSVKDFIIEIRRQLN